MREIEVQLFDNSNWIAVIEHTYSDGLKDKILFSKEKFYNLFFLVSFECVNESIDSNSKARYSFELQFINCSLKCNNAIAPQDFTIRLLSIVNNIEFETMQARYDRSGKIP